MEAHIFKGTGKVLEAEMQEVNLTILAILVRITSNSFVLYNFNRITMLDLNIHTFRKSQGTTVKLYGFF